MKSSQFTKKAKKPKFDPTLAKAKAKASEFVTLRETLSEAYQNFVSVAMKVMRSQQCNDVIK